MEDFEKNPEWENKKKMTTKQKRVFFFSSVYWPFKKNEAIFLIFPLSPLLRPWMVFSFSGSIAE